MNKYHQNSCESIDFKNEKWSHHKQNHFKIEYCSTHNYLLFSYFNKYHSGMCILKASYLIFYSNSVKLL